ncbi:hypothetical protein Dimus_010368 [Dionaea muscipula]
MQVSSLRTMLRKRTRSTQKEQQMGQLTSDAGSDGCLQSGVAGQKQKTTSFFNVPGLFIGLAPKGVSDCDSVRSPTSPLDFKLFSNLSSSVRSPRCSYEGHQKSWDCNKVGLGIVDSLDDDDDGGRKLCGKIVGSISTKSILLGSQIRIRTPNSPTHISSCETPKSLPKNYVVFPHTHLKSPNLSKENNSDVLFETGEDPAESYPFAKFQSFSSDSRSMGSPSYGLADRRADSGGSRNFGLGNASVQEDSPSKSIGGNPNSEDISHKKLSSAFEVVGSDTGFVGYLSPSEIELSEDYTCVISHGPNPRTTHIFGDCILECHAGETPLWNRMGGVESASPKLVKCSKFSSSYPSDDFLSFCYFCKKKLEEGKDIYMYRGERAFCSSDCRLEEILIEQGMDKSISEGAKESPSPTQGGDNFENGMFLAVWRL